MLAIAKGYKVDLHGNLSGPRGPLPGVIARKDSERKKRGSYLSFSVRAAVSFKVFVHQLQAYQKYGDSLFGVGVHVRHLNGDSLDNSYANISIGSASENMLDRDPTVRKKHAQLAADVQKKWSDADVVRLRRLRKDGAKVSDLASAEGVGKGLMSYMLNGITYRNIPLDLE